MGEHHVPPTILVTGAGGGAGQSIIKSLHGAPYRIVACDGQPHAVGLFAADRGYAVPYAKEPGFVDALLEIAAAERASLLFSGLDAELPRLARAVDRFGQLGCTVVVSRPEVIDLADDKLATSEFLAGIGLPSPWTYDLASAPDERVTFPAVLKPRRGGARSKGVHVVRDAADMTRTASGLDASNYVVQEYLAGDEHTCGTVTLDGVCYGPIVMRRILRDGDTHRAYVVRDRAIDDVVTRAATALDPFGACNFQLRVVRGLPYIFEINARCSGTTGARSLAGFNEPSMIADALLSGKRPEFAIREMAILRYWNEFVVSSSRIDAMELAGKVEGDGTRF